MTSSIISARRYIAIPFTGGSLTHDGAMRIINKSGVATPCRWSARNQRLESVATEKAASMYEATKEVRSAVLKACPSAKFLTLEEVAAIFA